MKAVHTVDESHGGNCMDSSPPNGPFQQLNRISRRFSVLTLLRELAGQPTDKNDPLTARKQESKDDVVVRLEIMPDSTAKFWYRFIFVSAVFGLGALLVQVCLKWSGMYEVKSTWSRVSLLNLIVSSICMVAMFAALGSYAFR